MTIIRKKTLRLLLCDYQRTARYYTIYRTLKRWSSDDFTTILRLSAGRSCDYYRSCYDYSSRNAATIARPYWLSGESPKKDAAVSRQWFRAARRAPAAGLPRRVEGAGLTRCQISSYQALTLHRMQAGCTDPPPLAWSALCCTAGHGSITGTRAYIHYYNRAAVLTCTASRRSGCIWYRWRCYGAVMHSSVAQAVHSRFVWLLYCVRLNGSNCRKRTCKALCAVLWCGWYNCINGAKRTVNNCIWLYCSKAK